MEAGLTDLKMLLITEEYGYRHWTALLTPKQWAELEARWRTIKGLNCLVPVPFLVRGAELSSPEEFAAIEEEADVRGYQLARAHIHQSDDSHIDGIDYRIPAADNFEIDGRVYSEAELDKLYDDAQKDFRAKQYVKFSARSPMPLRTVEQLVMLKNEVMDFERTAYNLRIKLDAIVNELAEHLEQTKQVEFKEI